MQHFQLADCYEYVAKVYGDAPALIQGPRTLTWGEVDTRATRTASWLLSHAHGPGSKVALYTYNHPAYMEGVLACFKAGLVPVNVNYRYRAGELTYLLDNSDTEVAIVHEDFVDTLASIQKDLPKLRAALVVSDGSHADLSPLTHADYETVATTPAPEVTGERSPEDLILIYTGGTTGIPKGVMWRHQDMFEHLMFMGDVPRTWEAFCERVNNPPLRLSAIIAPPLMHGTGFISAMVTWIGGNANILLEDPKRFDPADVWRNVERNKAGALVIVGDPFAKPLLQELDKPETNYDISSLFLMSSSGVMWSQEVKDGLLRHNPNMTLLDNLGSSESLGMGAAISNASGKMSTARFPLTDRVRLFDADLKPLPKEPGTRGLVGVGGPQPLGYYKDSEKTAKTFVELPEGRYSIPGDWALIDEDGQTYTLLGRGGACINTGGEKVFPEEVETVVKRFRNVKDAVVVGVPDDKWGEAVTAVVSAEGELDPDEVAAFVKSQLAPYKAPKHFVQVAEVFRSPSGKADYKQTKELAVEALRRR